VASPYRESSYSHFFETARPCLKRLFAGPGPGAGSRAFCWPLQPPARPGSSAPKGRSGLMSSSSVDPGPTPTPFFACAGARLRPTVGHGAPVPPLGGHDVNRPLTNQTPRNCGSSIPLRPSAQAESHTALNPPIDPDNSALSQGSIAARQGLRKATTMKSRRSRATTGRRPRMRLVGAVCGGRQIDVGPMTAPRQSRALSHSTAGTTKI